VCLAEIGGGSDPRPLLILSDVYPLWPLANQPIPRLVGTRHTNPTNDFPGDLALDVNGQNLHRPSGKY
jgi:hypothetical protein